MRANHGLLRTLLLRFWAQPKEFDGAFGENLGSIYRQATDLVLGDGSEIRHYESRQSSEHGHRGPGRHLSRGPDPQTSSQSGRSRADAEQLQTGAGGNRCVLPEHPPDGAQTRKEAMNREFKTLALGLVMVALFGCQPDAAEVIEPGLDNRLQKIAEPFFANRDFSGIVAVARGGRMIGKATVGFSDFQSSTAHDEHTSFHVASISKTFTAAAIRRLASQGRLSLDDPLSDFLPDFPDGDRITLLHLLGHQSGVPDYWSLPDVSAYSSRQTSTEEIIAWLASQQLDFAPGSASAYSNSGYALLAAVIEQVAEQSYHEYLHQEIFPAASLKETSLYSNDADAVGYSPAYGRDRIEPSPPYDPSMLVGAGSLKSTASDLLGWCGSFNSEFSNTESTNASYGWGVRQKGKRRWVEQTGRNPGFSAHLRAYPDSGVCIVVLSNIESDSVAALGAAAAATVFGELVTGPAERPAIALSQDELAPYVGRFEIFPGNTVEVALGGDGLVLRGRNGAFLPLEATGKDTFFYRQLYTTIAAERDEAGKVTALLWGGSAKLPRVE